MPHVKTTGKFEVERTRGKSMRLNSLNSGNYAGRKMETERICFSVLNALY